MQDTLFLAGLIGALAAFGGFVHLCDRIVSSQDRDEAQR
jgi:hypothetical protein